MYQEMCCPISFPFFDLRIIGSCSNIPHGMKEEYTILHVSQGASLNSEELSAHEGMSSFGQHFRSKHVNPGYNPTVYDIQTPEYLS